MSVRIKVNCRSSFSPKYLWTWICKTCCVFWCLFFLLFAKFFGRLLNLSSTGSSQRQLLGKRPPPLVGMELMIIVMMMMMMYHDYDNDYDDDDKNNFVKLMLMLFVKSEDEIWRNYWQRPAQC